ncbi:MAG: hypothetical protein ACRDTT_18580 [Pseudonocardiaceae bacterium]
MSTQADRARERTERIRRIQQTPAEDRPRQRLQSERSKPVRRTVDLPPTHHQKLTTWCSEAAVELGVARITGQDVLRSLVARLLTDETLARKLRADLADELTQR